MRTRPHTRTLALVLLVLLAGCAASEEDSSLPRTSDDGTQATDMPEAAPTALEAPTLRPGQSWTYAASGYWNTVPEVTIVVARADSRGYLFAAQERRQLDDEVAWDLPYLGETDLQLRTIRSYNSEPHPSRLLDFPLTPGKSWQFANVEVRAQPETIRVLGQDVPGYRITGQDDRTRVLIEYAPSIGYITTYQVGAAKDGRLHWGLELQRVGDKTPWTWYGRGAEIVIGPAVDPGRSSAPAQAPHALEVTAQDAEVFIWMIGSDGARATVAPPPGQGEPRVLEAKALPSIHKASMKAAPGTWRFSGQAADAQAFLYLQAHALRWESSTS